MNPMVGSGRRRLQPGCGENRRGGGKPRGRNWSGGWLPSTEGVWRNRSNSELQHSGSGRTRSLPRAGSRRGGGREPEAGSVVDGGTNDQTLRREAYGLRNPREEGWPPRSPRGGGPAHGTRASEWNPRSEGRNLRLAPQGGGPGCGVRRNTSSIRRSKPGTNPAETARWRRGSVRPTSRLRSMSRGCTSGNWR